LVRSVQREIFKVRLRHLLFLFAICLALLLVANTVEAQDLGHKLPGLIGLDAGRIPQPGLYVLDRIASYRADEIRNRQGNVIPIGDVQLRALANGAGVLYTFALSKSGDLVLTVTGAAPIARLRISVEARPEVNIDRFGLTDFYIQPARLGWRKSRFDLVGSYGLYLPSGISELAGGKGLSSGHVTHQFSAGGTVYADKDRTVFVTALASYDLNLRKRRIDITRGDTMQVQGGAGVSRFDRRFEAGLAGYWLRQVRSDRGADIPPVFRGARDRVYGLGPEMAVMVKPIRSQIRARYEWDLGAQSRPKGSIFVVGFAFFAQR
jgi:hypothetical protein